MKRSYALRKLNNKKKKLNPEEMIDVGVKSNDDHKVWRKVIEKIEINTLPHEQVIDLFFQSKSDYFRNHVDYKYIPAEIKGEE